MPASRPFRDGDFLISLVNGGYTYALGQTNQEVLGADFGIFGWQQGYIRLVGERVFGVLNADSVNHPLFAAAITNGTAPGLYVREGDDTSDWETYRQVLARRVEEAMAARRGGVGVGETAAKTATARQDDEIRVGDVVEVVSCSDTRYTRRDDIGGGGRVTQRGDYSVQLTPVDGLRLPSVGIAGLADVRKVTSPSPSSPQTVAVNFSPMPDGEAARIEVAITDEVRRRISSQLVSSSDGTTRQRVVNPVPPAPAVDARLQFSGERETTASRIRQGVQRELDRLDGRIDTPPQPQPQPQPPSPPSRFSLLEVDADPNANVKDTAPQALKVPVDLAALQQELRAEREAKRALAAAQTPPGRFDLLECDLPAVPAVAVETPPKRPAASSPPPRRPVETITDLTAARSPLELARMLEGLNDELSTMMRQREVN